MIIPDFETRSRADLFKCGSSVYARHESTEVLCLAWTVNGGDVRLWVPGDPAANPDSWSHLDELFAEIENGTLVCPHNAMFERQIWRHICHGRFGWPDVPFDQWRCSAAACSRLTLPRSLAGAGAALGLTIQKDDAGHRLMLKMCKPRKATKDNNAEWHETPEDLQRLYEYCERDVETQTLLSDTAGQLTPSELKVWQLDQRINLRGIPVNREGIEHALAIVDAVHGDVCQQIQELTDGKVSTPKQVKAIRAWLLEECDVDLPNLSAETVKNTLSKELPEHARQLLELRQMAGKASTAKLQAFLNRCDEDGRVRNNLVYHGAATGRWAGSGVQIQNFPRGILNRFEIELIHEILPDRNARVLDMLLASPMDCISSSLRSFIQAEPDKRLMVCDFASIEARVLAWVAGQNDLVQVFRDGGDVYKVMASSIYDKPTDAITKSERQMGKVAILGCFGADTEVLTNSGWKQIQHVTTQDLVWDGDSFVEHSGVIDQGVGAVLSLDGIQVTPDHEILTSEGWVEAWQVHEDTKYLKSASVLANGKLSRSSVAREAASRTYASVHAESNQYPTFTTCTLESPHVAHSVPSAKRVKQDTETQSKPCRISGCEECGLAVSARSSRDVRTRVRLTSTTTVAGELSCATAGTTLQRSYATYRRLNGGQFPSLSSTALIMIGAMSPEMCGWQPVASRLKTQGRISISHTAAQRCAGLSSGDASPQHIGTRPPSCERSEKENRLNKSLRSKNCARVRTFDIANAGPQNRFTIRTNNGVLIVHNCGYGMGHKQFVNACRLMAGVKISRKFSKQVVGAYRKTNDRISSFWREVNTAAVRAIELHQPHRVGRLEIDANHEWLTIKLPSGRQLHYREPELVEVRAPWSEGFSGTIVFEDEQTEEQVEQIVNALEELDVEIDEADTLRIDVKRIPKEMRQAVRRLRLPWHELQELEPKYINQVQYKSVNSVTRKWCHNRTYGAKLVENLVQGIARDFLVEAMLRVENAGYPIIGTVHDEIISEVPYAFGSQDEFDRIMSQVPTWGSGCPTAVEGYEAERYRK